MGNAGCSGLGTWRRSRLRRRLLGGVPDRLGQREVSTVDLPLPLFEYYLDESDPDIVMLCRQDSSFVAAFSARGATKEGILEAAYEDYRHLPWRLRAGVEWASFLDEPSEHAAIVERSGTIVAANKAWKRFAKDNEADLSKISEGANYLDVCDRATGEQSEDARSFAEGLRSVLSDREE